MGIGDLVDDRIDEGFFGAMTRYSTKRNLGSLQNVTLPYPKTERRLNHKRNGGPPDHGTVALAQRTIHQANPTCPLSLRLLPHFDQSQVGPPLTCASRSPDLLRR